MDAYLAKPIRPAELLDAITRATAGIAVRPIVAVDTDAFDRADVLARVEGDLELLGELAAMFRVETKRMISEITFALVTSNPRELQRVAHLLKSSAGSLGGTAVSRTAAAFETMGRENAFIGGAGLLKTLEGELFDLDRSLVELYARSAA
jgi:HPt (histidine-containing phosphotransfer) domain-containing protein